MEKNIGSQVPEKIADNNAVEKFEYSDIKFSAHAIKRIEKRNIKLSTEELIKIKVAVERAVMKGAKESLVILDKAAMIVNIPNRTVVTAVSVLEGNDNFFTNIDSVIFA